MKGYEIMNNLPYVKYQKIYLKEYSDDTLTRCILWNKEKSDLGQEFYDSISKIQNTLNLTIQNLNLKVDRNIPYMTVNCFNYITNGTRIVVRDKVEFNDENILLTVDSMMDHFTNISHNVDCFQAAGKALIERTSDYNNTKHFDVTILFDKMIRELTIIDILLDIAYFNSYSFLRDMSLSEKRAFSRQKSEFFKSEGLPTVFDETRSDDLDYYSIAFSCHKPNISDMEHYEYEIDIDKYISIWDRFIKKYYGDKTHKEISVQKQIMHRRNNHLPNNYYLEFNDLQPGVYYILRTEEKNIPPKYLRRVMSLFGIKKTSDMSVGYLKRIESKDFDQYTELYDFAGVSVFKIVVQ